MFVVGNFVGAIAGVINTLLSLYSFVIIGAAIISWVNPDPWNPIVRFLRGATDPFLNLFRRILPGFLVGGSGIDLSPIAALITVEFVRRIVVGNLNSIAMRMG
jgi:YggT family protein